jgi:hypothetical protein
MKRTPFRAAIVCFFVAASASAQENAAHARAQELFRQGRKLLEAGRLDDACPTLEESLRLEPTLVTRMNLAACYEATGRAASALREFAAAADTARREGNVQLAGVADEHARAISEKTHRLAVQLTAKKEGQALVLDGHTIAEDALGRPLPVDPGTHVAEAHAPGHRSWRKVIVVEGQPRVITETIPALEPDTPGVTPPRATSNLVPVLFTGGVAVAGIGLGSYFGVRTFEKRDEYERECDPNGECSQTGLDLQAEARSAALVSTIAFSVGIVAAGACVYFLVTGSAPRASAMTAPFGVRF